MPRTWRFRRAWRQTCSPHPPSRLLKAAPREVTRRRGHIPCRVVIRQVERRGCAYTAVRAGLRQTVCDVGAGLPTAVSVAPRESLVPSPFQHQPPVSSAEDNWLHRLPTLGRPAPEAGGESRRRRTSHTPRRHETSAAQGPRRPCRGNAGPQRAWLPPPGQGPEGRASGYSLPRRCHTLQLTVPLALMTRSTAEDCPEMVTRT